MKKIVILFVVLALFALPLAGCCKRVDPATMVTTTSFTNCMAAAQQLACNPTPAQQAAAQQILAFVQSGINIASIITHVPITAEQAQLIFSTIQSGGCVLMNDLMTAMSWYQAIVATVQTQQAMQTKAGGKMAMQPPDVNALYHW
jgi:hypothetical protein